MTEFNRKQSTAVTITLAVLISALTSAMWCGILWAIGLPEVAFNPAIMFAVFSAMMFAVFSAMMFVMALCILAGKAK